MAMDVDGANMTIEEEDVPMGAHSFWTLRDVSHPFLSDTSIVAPPSLLPSRHGYQGARRARRSARVTYLSAMR